MVKIKDSFNEVFGDKKKVLCVFAHPDDMELICGGTMARFINGGGKVRLVVTTNGGKGVKNLKGISEEGFAKRRSVEQIGGGLIIGIPKEENFNLGIADGEVESSVENIGKIVFHIRQFKPDIVITHNPSPVFVSFSKTIGWVNHRDHRNTALIAVDASYPYSRDRGFFRQQLERDGLEPHEVNCLLMSDSYTDPSLRYFEVGDYLQQREKALLAHKSVTNPAMIKDLMEEIKFKEGSFEPLGFRDFD